MTADEIIETLGLQGHPEGGWFAESYRDFSDGSERGVSSLIYFLLKRGERSHWHRLHSAVEVWHYYSGDSLNLHMSGDAGPVETVVLGPDLANGERPQAVVPAGCWQAAETRGDYTLVGCTVAPGFVFDDFELAVSKWAPGA